jgi:hypothetical protein
VKDLNIIVACKDSESIDLIHESSDRGKVISYCQHSQLQQQPRDMASSDKPLALVALVHTKSAEQRSKTIALNQAYSPFFRSPSINLSTATVFTVATRPKANLGMVPKGENETLLGRVEIWNSPAALDAVKRTPEYKTFQSAMVEAGNVEVSEWIHEAGFVARKSEAETPKAGIVMLAKFVLKEENVDANRAGLVGVLG